jgi:hypothetical protein
MYDSFWYQYLYLLYCALSFFLTPISTGRTVPLNAAMVSPYLDRMRGCQFSENRSSVSIGLKSSTRPPKMVSIVDELLPMSVPARNFPRVRGRTYFALPNILWNVLSEYSGFSALASARRLASCLLRSSFVKICLPSGPLPVAAFNNSSTSIKSGFP